MKKKGTLMSIAAAALCALGAAAATPLTVTEANPTVKQDFNSVSGMQLPEGWAINKHIGSFRVTDSWADATDQVEFIKGANLASNETNGLYYFPASDNATDYALGGITTNATDKTNTVSVMTALTNGAERPISSVDMSYVLEKYRKGNNPAGWTVAVRYSKDGTNWTDAFKNDYEPDSETAGAAAVPITTTPVSHQVLMADVQPGETLYIAWMSAVKSGTTSSASQVFGLDDVELTVNFADADARYIYVENATKHNALSLYAPGHDDYYGAKPGETTTLTKIVNGVSYGVWDARSGAYGVEVYGGNTLIGSATTASTGDTYLCASPEGVNVIDDPDTYTGWTDPTRPPFVKSGIYIRGELNSWGSPADWEFSKESDTTYALYDKTLSGMFKVADATWSKACNYGSNGQNVMVDEPYALVSGTDTNISCGNYIFTCKRILLTIVDGEATLLLEAEDSEAGLTTVYMVGDLNDWNYMSKTGELTLGDDGLFRGRVSMKAGDDGKSHWLVYLRQGKCGAYGADESRDGVLVKGSTATVASEPGTYDVNFDLSTGAYTLTSVETVASYITLDPQATVLVPDVPAEVRVLSLNNSLIHYNDQARMFNEIARSMGKDAEWTKHTNLGKTLQYHWEEGEGEVTPGTPGAKMMVRSQPWSHIILQEQTALPRTNLETFRNSVEQWVGYIRENCPNPNAVIILPMNWHYAQDWSNFDENNKILMANYASVAAELGVTVCPVAVAYQAKFEKDGGATTESEWFLPGDDRHPTIRSTYMAACMEYGLIYNEDPTAITYYPTYTTENDKKAIDAEIAADMRAYAKNALEAYTNTVDHHAATVQFTSAVFDDYDIEISGREVAYSVSGGGEITADGLFKSDGSRGTFTVTATSGDFKKEAKVTVADAVTGVRTISGEGEGQVKYENGVVTTGHPTEIAVYNAEGICVIKTYGERCELSNLAPGIYLLRAADQTLKIAK